MQTMSILLAACHSIPSVRPPSHAVVLALRCVVSMMPRAEAEPSINHQTVIYNAAVVTLQMFLCPRSTTMCIACWKSSHSIL